MVKVRIPPSPTGSLHVGTARVALYNYLFAKQHGGQIVLRSEDTDKERSKQEFEDEIQEGITWLGLSWDEFHRQSERTTHYAAAIQKLIDEDKAYQVEGPPAGGEAVKLRVEPQEISFEDEIRGTVTSHSNTWGGDFVIARSKEHPVYHLAVVVDDAEMGITHVIRGEDIMSSTARQILLQQALGYELPKYVHLPLLLDENRKKLSKRNNETSLLAYREQGYLPEAMVNYLALLGWNPGDDREIFSLEELVKEFNLEKVQKSGAIFSAEKLQDVNKQYLKELSGEELLARTPTLPDPPLLREGTSRDQYWMAALKTEQERVATLAALPDAVKFFEQGGPGEYEKEMLVWRKSDAETTIGLLEKLVTQVEALGDDDFEEKKLEEKLMGWIDREELGRGDTLWPMRVALTGKEHSPGPFEVAAVLGKDETLRRLREATEKI